LDTADTGSVLDSDSDVPLLSPLGGPGVLDNVEVLSVLRSISDSEDTVIGWVPQEDPVITPPVY